MWKVYLAAAIFTICGAGLWHYNHTLKENRTLKTELKTANATIAATDEAATKHAAINRTERMRTDEIDKAPDSDDGPVAPVLQRTLNGLR